MGQQEVINLLKKNKKRLTAKEIADKLKQSNVGEPLRKLHKEGIVKRIKSKKEYWNSFQYWI